MYVHDLLVFVAALMYFIITLTASAGTLSLMQKELTVSYNISSNIYFANSPYLKVTSIKKSIFFNIFMACLTFY